VIKEIHNRPEDTDYSQEFRYETDGACTLNRVWVDYEGGFWIESNDGQRVVIPIEFRKLITKKIKGLTFR
jgi:hypothetical protein